MKLEEEISEILKSGRESAELEVKEDFSCLEKILKEIVAIANTNGGKVLIGWSEKADEYELKGIKQKTLNLLKDEKINDKVDKYLSKKVKFKLHIIKKFDKSNKTVGIIEVYENEGYLIVFNKDFTIKENNKDITLFRKGDIYVRHGSKTEKLVQQDLDDFLLKVKDFDYSDYKELIGLRANEMVDLFLLSSKNDQRKIKNNLFKILISFKEEWRYKSAGALSKILNKKEKYYLEKLIEVYNESNIPEIKNKVLYIIREVGYENVDNFLLDQLRLDDLDLSGLVVAAIGTTKNKKTWTKFLKFLDKLDLARINVQFANRVIHAFDLNHHKKNIPYLVNLLENRNIYSKGNAGRILVRLSKEYRINQRHENTYDSISNYIDSNFRKIIKNINENRKYRIRNVKNNGIHILEKTKNIINLFLVVSVEIAYKKPIRNKKSIFRKNDYITKQEEKAIYLVIKYIDEKIEILDKSYFDLISGFY